MQNNGPPPHPSDVVTRCFGFFWGFFPSPHCSQAQQETQKAALRYERAVSMHNAAREMVFVAEQGVMADKNRLDPTWQEMLNHATCKVRGREGKGGCVCVLFFFFLRPPPDLLSVRSRMLSADHPSPPGKGNGGTRRQPEGRNIKRFNTMTLNNS